MNWMMIFFLGAGAYILGSIPTAVWLGKWMYGKDVRQYGSGNAGFSNALRVLGPKAGIPVLLIDVGKGFAAVLLARLADLPEEGIVAEVVPICYGILAFVGHLFPIFASFQGGKGVATGLGMILALFPPGALIGLVVFLITIFTFRMMSLGSMLGSISLPFSVYAYFTFSRPILLGFTVFIALSIIWTHRSNIGRMLHGTENKIWFRKKTGSN